MEASQAMHDLIVKNSRGQSKVFYFTDNDTNDKGINIDEYNILFIDEKVKRINHKLYKYVVSKSQNILEINSGEDTKRIDNVFHTLKEIELLKIEPVDRALVVGGGTIQDLAGTCLGLMKRGTKWDFIPTTILAQCDSCIGSKTSINSFNSKNSYGLFCSPEYIYIINSIALGQSDKDLMSGFGDALHYLFLNPSKEYNYLKKQMVEILEKGINKYFQSTNAVLNLAYHCHLIKKEYIEIDEFDQGCRKKLNLGHSFGHAIEKLFNHTIPHGIAVMHGIYMAYIIEIYINTEYRPYEEVKISELVQYVIEILRSQTEYSPEKVQGKILDELDLYLSILKRDKKNKMNEFIVVLLSQKPYLKSLSYSELKDLLPKVSTMLHSGIYFIQAS